MDEILLAYNIHPERNRGKLTVIFKNILVLHQPVHQELAYPPNSFMANIFLQYNLAKAGFQLCFDVFAL